MTQRQLPQVAGSHVQGHRQNNVDADGHQDTGPIVGNDTLCHKKGEDAPQRHCQQKVDEVAHGHRDSDRILFHAIHPLIPFL